MSISPGPSLMTASPIMPCGPNLMWATSPSTKGLPSLTPTGILASVSGVWLAEVS